MRRIRNLFFDNLLLKTISILFAILLWILVNGEGDIQNNVNIPISISFPKGYRVSDQSASEVNLGLLGTRVALLGANLNNISMKPIDLSDSKGGTTTVIIKGGNFENIPLGLEIVKIDPAKLIIELDRYVEKSMPVSLETSGQLPEGFLLGGVRIDPSLVEVSGIAKIVSPLIRIYTEPINLSGHMEKFNVEALIDNPNPGQINIQPDRVAAEIAIVEEIIERGMDLSILQPVLDSSLEWLGAQPATARVKLSGPYRTMQSLKAETLGSLTLEFTLPPIEALNNEPFSITAHLVRFSGEAALKKGLKIVSIDPPKVTIKLIKKPDAPVNLLPEENSDRPVTEPNRGPEGTPSQP